MPRKENIHIVPHEDGWAVTREGAERVSRVVDTQREAIDIGTTIAERERGELIIHGENGQIRERNSYGNDPFPPRG